MLKRDAQVMRLSVHTRNTYSEYFFIHIHKYTHKVPQRTMADLTLPIIGFVAFVGYLFKKKDEGYSNIYNSEADKAGKEELLQKSIQNHIDARNPTFTGIYDPLLNAVGHDATSNVNIATEPSSYDYIRLKDPTRPVVIDTPPGPSVLEPFQNDNYHKFNQQDEENAPDSHSNMVPFFKGNKPEAVYEQLTTLGQRTGQDSDFFKSKQEIGPLFSPVEQDIYQVTYTDNLDYTRFLSSRFKQGEKPFDDVRVPKPKMEVYRDAYKNQIPDIDELRVNKQESFNPQIIPGNRQSETVRGDITVPDSNAPTTYYENNEAERLFTGPASIIAKKMDENMYAKYTSKQDWIANDYVGSAGQSQTVSVDRNEEYKEPFKIENKKYYLDNTVSTGHSGHGDYGSANSFNYETQRSTTKAAPIMNANNTSINIKLRPEDLPKTSLKEIMDSIQYTGNVHTTFRRNTTDILESDEYDTTLKTTTKETNIRNNHVGNLHKPGSMGYLTTNYDNKITLRELMKNVEYFTGAQSNNVPIDKDAIGYTRSRDLPQSDYINHENHAKVIQSTDSLGLQSRQGRDKVSDIRLESENDGASIQKMNNPFVIR